MSGDQNKRPAKLDLSGVQGAPKTTANNKPKSVTLVVSGSAGWNTVDALTTKWHSSSGDNKALGQEGLKLRALVYELGQTDPGIDDTPDKFQAGHIAPDNLPITVIQPVQGVPPQLPNRLSPAHEGLSYSLATISDKDQLAQSQDKWLELLQQAGDRKYTLEFALRSPSATSGKDDALEGIRDQVEELLGKAHGAAQQKIESEVAGGADSGYFLVFGESQGKQCYFAQRRKLTLVSCSDHATDQLASPPFHLSSSQLPRSQELSDWASFVGRVALHPRTFLKISPFPLTQLLNAGLVASSRTADYSSAMLQKATDAAANAVETAEGAVSGVVGGANKSDDGTAERIAEGKRKLRIFLDVVVEAFGVDRLIWSASLGAGQGVGSTFVGNNEEGAIVEWYEMVLDGLVGMGLDEDSLQRIFSE